MRADELKEVRHDRRKTDVRVIANMRLTAIGQLSAGVAHELNNPLSVILGFAQSLSNQFEQQDPIQTPLKTIEREAMRCKRLVQDLLNFSRVPKPGKVMEDVVQVLDGALSLIMARARIQQVEVIRDFADDLPLVFLDRQNIQQLVINLCINAIGAMPKGGQLTVKAIFLSEARDNAGVTIQVSDTGTGIAPEIQLKMFEPFFTTKDIGKGTGLGLSMVKDIVRDHEGRLEFVSVLDLGTTFTVWLPLISAPSLQASPVKDPAPNP